MGMHNVIISKLTTSKIGVTRVYIQLAYHEDDTLISQNIVISAIQEHTLYFQQLREDIHADLRYYYSMLDIILGQNLYLSYNCKHHVCPVLLKSLHNFLVSFVWLKALVELTKSLSIMYIY